MEPKLPIDFPGYWRCQECRTSTEESFRHWVEWGQERCSVNYKWQSHMGCAAQAYLSPYHVTTWPRLQTVLQDNVYPNGYWSCFGLVFPCLPIHPFWNKIIYSVQLHIRCMWLDYFYIIEVHIWDGTFILSSLAILWAFYYYWRLY